MVPQNRVEKACTVSSPNLKKLSFFLSRAEDLRGQMCCSREAFFTWQSEKWKTLFFLYFFVFLFFVFAWIFSVFLYKDTESSNPLLVSLHDKEGKRFWHLVPELSCQSSAGLYLIIPGHVSYVGISCSHLSSPHSSQITWISTWLQIPNLIRYFPNHV